MQRAIEQFNSNIKSAKDMGILYEHLTENLKLPNDLSDVLRAQWAYAVSALDKLVHELVRIGMLQAFSGQRPKTKKFNDFPISLETCQKIQQLNQSTETLPTETPEHYFDQEIIVKHRHLSFQDPDKISDILSLIWDEKQKWQKIALLLNESDDSIKKELKNIVKRRNQIVHEADIDIQTNLRTPISASDTKQVVEFLHKLGESIFNAISM